MNELAKERDKISTQNESLRKELAAATAEVEHVRNNVQVEKAQFENQLGEERRAKENAKKQLEARMEEMQASRMTRKSKFKYVSFIPSVCWILLCRHINLLTRLSAFFFFGRIFSCF
jgi:hypothetical protein